MNTKSFLLFDKDYVEQPVHVYYELQGYDYVLDVHDLEGELIQDPYLIAQAKELLIKLLMQEFVGE